MKKYLWIVLFLVTNLGFAQPSVDLTKSNTDNNLLIQLMDSKLANIDNKLTAVEQSNKDGIADLKARVDEKLADKFKQLDDRGGRIDSWLSVLGIVLSVFGILTPFGAFLLNRKIDENIITSKKILEEEVQHAVIQVENKLKEADRLINLIQNNYHKSEELNRKQKEMLANPPNEVNEQNKQDIEKINEVLSEKPESQLTAQDWFIRGLNALNNKEYYEAITYNNFAIKLNPPKELTANIYNNRGSAKYELGNHSDALSDYDKSIDLNPANAYYFYNRGTIKADLQQYEEAVKDYDKAIELNPKAVIFYSNRGVALIELRRYGEAEKDYSKAIELTPSNSLLYNDRGNVKIYLKQYEAALNDFNKSLELNLNDDDTYIKCSVVLLKLQRYDEAIRNCDRAIELNPKGGGAYFNKACAYALMKNKTEALNWLEKALQLDYSVEKVLKDEDWKNYLNDNDFKNLIAKYNKQ